MISQNHEDFVISQKFDFVISQIRFFLFHKLDFLISQNRFFDIKDQGYFVISKKSIL